MPVARKTKQHARRKVSLPARLPASVSREPVSPEKIRDLFQPAWQAVERLGNGTAHEADRLALQDVIRLTLLLRQHGLDIPVPQLMLLNGAATSINQLQQHPGADTLRSDQATCQLLAEMLDWAITFFNTAPAVLVSHAQDMLTA